MSTPYEQAVEAAAQQIAWEDGISRPGYHEMRRAHIAVDAALPHLLALIEALCRDTDGNWLDPRAELPVGEFIAALASIKGQPS